MSLVLKERPSLPIPNTCRFLSLPIRRMVRQRRVARGDNPLILVFSTDGTIRLSSFNLSKDGRYAVYGRTAIPGSDWVELHVIEVATHRVLPDTISWGKFSGGAWRGDGFYYSRYPTPPAQAQLTSKNENQKVYYHKLGTEAAQDVLVYAFLFANLGVAPHFE